MVCSNHVWSRDFLLVTWVNLLQLAHCHVLIFFGSSSSSTLSFFKAQLLVDGLDAPTIRLGELIESMLRISTGFL